MPFVLDASAALPLLLSDEQPAAEILDRFRSGDAALVPELFLYELANVLVTAVRRGRHTETAALDQLKRFAMLPIETRRTRTGIDALIVSALENRLSAYDTAYLELARTTASPLATADAALARAAASMRIELIVPLP